MEKYFPYVVLIATGLSRMIPHISNFSPVYASVNYSYVTIKNSILSTISLVLMLYISDLLLHFFFNPAGKEEIYPLYGWWMVYIYPIHIFNGFISKLIIKKPNQIVNIGVTCTITGLSFFMLSNFGEFWFSKDDHSLKTLREVFILAIPFFPLTILSNVAFSIVFFGLHVLLFNRREIISQSKEEDSLKIPINNGNILTVE